MSFWRTFMGDYGQDLNIADAQASIEALQKAVQEKGILDQRQDAAAAKLEARVRELEHGLAALMKRLIESGVLTPADLSEFARFTTAAARKAEEERAAAPAEGRAEARTEARRDAGGAPGAAGAESPAGAAGPRGAEILRELDQS